MAPAEKVQVRLEDQSGEQLSGTYAASGKSEFGGAGSTDKYPWSCTLTARLAGIPTDREFYAVKFDVDADSFGTAITGAQEIVRSQDEMQTSSWIIEESFAIR